LSDVENNKRNVSSGNLSRVANVLGALLDYLFRGISPEPIARGPDYDPTCMSFIIRVPNRATGVEVVDATSG
jgi:hypothetical protein